MAKYRENKRLTVYPSPEAVAILCASGRGVASSLNAAIETFAHLIRRSIRDLSRRVNKKDWRRLATAIRPDSFDSAGDPRYQIKAQIREAVDAGRIDRAVAIDEMTAMEAWAVVWVLKNAGANDYDYDYDPAADGWWLAAVGGDSDFSD